IGGAVFFAIYLASAALLAHRSTTDVLRRKASMEDEGIVVIVLITLAIIALSIGSLMLLLESGNQSGWTLIPAVLNVPLGWATLHTVMAFHYAHLFYSPPGESEARDAKQTGGLEFPRSDEPGISDFLYFSFVVGMTAQTSDVDVTSREMRRATLTHG